MSRSAGSIAVALAIGGVMLTGWTSDLASGVVLGAATDDPTVAVVQGTFLQVGLDNAGTAMFDDPRLTGTWTLVEEAPDGDCDEMDVSLATMRVENDEGSWRGGGDFLMEDPMMAFGLTGEGGYEGLSALLFWVGGGDEEPYRLLMAGAIFPGVLPPVSVPDCPAGQ